MSPSSCGLYINNNEGISYIEQTSFVENASDGLYNSVLAFSNVLVFEKCVFSTNNFSNNNLFWINLEAGFINATVRKLMIENCLFEKVLSYVAAFIYIRTFNSNIEILV